MNNNLSNIKKTKYYLDKNECVGFHTETVYGIGANGLDKEAINKIFKIKTSVNMKTNRVITFLNEPINIFPIFIL